MWSFWRICGGAGAGARVLEGNGSVDAYLTCSALNIGLGYMEPDKKHIDDAVERIVRAVHPRRIILFGSAVRGEMNLDSDLDLLVVMPDGIHRRKTAQLLLLLQTTSLPLLTAMGSRSRERGNCC